MRSVKMCSKGKNDMKNKNFVFSLLIVVIIGFMVGILCFRFLYTSDPEKDLTTAMNHLASQHRFRASRYLDYDGLYNSIGEKKISSAVMRDFQYEIKEVRHVDREPEAAADILVRNRDMEKLYGNFLMDAYELAASNASKGESAQISEKKLKKQINEMLLQRLKEDSSQMTEKTITVELYRKGRHWWVDLDQEDFDAICGGYLTAQEEAVETLGNLSAEALGRLEADYSIQIDNPWYILRNSVHFIVEDVWNDTLCDIVSSINAGTDQNGKEYDFTAGKQKLEKLMQQKQSFDTNIKAITDPEYEESVKAWNNVSAELDKLVKELEEKEAEPMDFDYLPDTSAFEESMKAFVNIVYNRSQE